MRFPVVLFDLDGTLIDSGPMIIASARHAAREILGREPEDDLVELVRANIGGPGLVTMMESIDPTRVDELIDAYRMENERLHDELEAFDEVVLVLKELRLQGRRTAIVTAKRRATVELAFDRFPDLRDATDVLVSSDDTDQHKPHPAPLVAALDRLGAVPGDAAYVGDSPFDIQAAKAAGTFAVAVGWGGIHSAGRLAEEEPDVLVEEPSELLDVL